MTKPWISDRESRQSKKAQAILVELRGGAPAPHLSPVARDTTSNLTKRQRHRRDSADFKAGRT